MAGYSTRSWCVRCPVQNQDELRCEVDGGNLDPEAPRQVTGRTSQPATDVENPQVRAQVQPVSQLHGGLSAADVELIDRREIV
jgi:hypothetical protein